MYTSKSITLVGYGVSSQALCEHFMARGIYPTIRNQEKIEVPSGITLITEDYLRCTEDIIFRSPVIRPDRIQGQGYITSEVKYALEKTRGIKIGVSGSDGKTTTSTLIYEMLKKEGRHSTLCGNIGTPVVSLCDKSDDSTYTVCELSSFQLIDYSPTLSVAVLTGISENHLDWHIDMAEYVRAKKGITENAKLCVLNYEDATLREMVPTHKPYILFGADPRDRACRGASHLVYIKDNAIFLDEGKVIDIGEIRLKGYFNLLNIQGAIGAVCEYVSLDAIREVLCTFTGAEGRMEHLGIVQGVCVVASSIDTTPSRTIATLSAFDKARCVIILGGYDKGVSYAPLKEALRGTRYAVVCGENGDKIENEIKGSVPFARASTLDEATKIAFGVAKCGDTVLFSPASASFDQFGSYKERQNKFKEIIRGLK